LHTPIIFLQNTHTHTHTHKMNLFLVALVASVALFCLTPTLSQPLGKTYDGYAQGNKTSPIWIEAYFDFLCPDSKASWPALKSVLQEHYNNQLFFTLHVFPLPYHQQAFVMAQAGVTIYRHLGLDGLWNFLELIFANQEKFWNAPTWNMTTNEVIHSIAILVLDVGDFPISKKDFIDGVNDPDVRSQAITSWKFAAARSVSGTPTFAMNGVFITVDPTWTKEKWIEFIDAVSSGNPSPPSSQSSPPLMSSSRHHPSRRAPSRHHHSLSASASSTPFPSSENGEYDYGE